MPNNPFLHQVVELSSIAKDVYLATPSDALDLVETGIAITATGAGNIRLTTVKGNDRTVPVAAGETLAVGFTRLWATNTTATGLKVYTL